MTHPQNLDNLRLQLEFASRLPGVNRQLSPNKVCQVVGHRGGYAMVLKLEAELTGKVGGFQSEIVILRTEYFVVALQLRL